MSAPNLREIVRDTTKSGNERYTWGQWKEILRTNNVHILTDDSNRTDSDMLAAVQARALILEECTFEFREYQAEFNKSDLTDVILALPPELHDQVNVHMANAESAKELYTQALEDSENQGEFESAVKTLLATLDEEAPPEEEMIPLSKRQPVFTKEYPDGGTLTLLVPEIQVAPKVVPETLAEKRTPAKMQGPKIVRDVAPKKKLTIDEWRAAYRELANTAPVERFLVTSDGSPIRVDINCVEGKPPFMYTKAFIPNIVGGTLDWYAQREGDEDIIGWKVILLPKARDEAMRHFDITQPYGLVTKIRIVRMAESGKSLLGEVASWK